MNKTDDILNRLQQAPQPRLDAPDELTERIMSRLPERGRPRPQKRQTGTPKLTRARRAWLYAAVGIAASVLLLIGVGVATRQENHPAELVADNAQKEYHPVVSVPNDAAKENHPVESVPNDAAKENHPVESVPNDAAKENHPVVSVSDDAEEEKHPVESAPNDAEKKNVPGVKALDGNLHYAAYTETEDTAAYQDPARVDEFISKLASVHALPIELTCSATMDSMVTSAVYVFPDKTTVSTSRQKVDVFGRLLQVACCYSDDTPGYLLKYSHLQFFFQLKDMRHQLQYLWIAERVNGKILLYSTCSPIDANVSSACYQEYRDELMHTRSIQTKTSEL